MSLGQHPRTAPARSILVCPASNSRMIAKAVASAADRVIVDLEDAVAPEAKTESRGNVVAALRDLDWGSKPRAYRINPVDTPWCYRDLIHVIEAAGDLVDVVIVPKVNNPAQATFVSTLLDQLEHGLTRQSPIAVEAQIESPAGLIAAREIARATPRLTALVWGPGDFAAAAGMPQTAIGAPNEHDANYPGHRFGYAMHELLIAARAAGLLAIDGPYANFRDLDGCRESGLLSRALGYDGKWCIHPDQVAVVNEVFTPSDGEVAAARALIDQYEAALAAGRGALAIDNVMIDAASIRLARATLARVPAPRPRPKS